MANIRKFLDLSTAHLKPETLTMLNTKDVDWPCYPTAYGWFMYACTEGVYGIPEEIVVAMQKARDLGCEYILYDADAEPQPELLPVFDHE